MRPGKVTPCVGFLTATSRETGKYSGCLAFRDCLFSASPSWRRERTTVSEVFKNLYGERDGVDKDLTVILSLLVALGTAANNREAWRYTSHNVRAAPLSNDSHYQVTLAPGVEKVQTDVHPKQGILICDWLAELFASHVFFAKVGNKWVPKRFPWFPFYERTCSPRIEASGVRLDDFWNWRRPNRN